MSTTPEIIRAQEAAWSLKPVQWWHRHLIGPARLAYILDENARLKRMLMDIDREAKRVKEEQGR